MNPITIPLLNPNEPEAMLAALHVTEGQKVAAGDLLCTLETTKSTADVESEGEGYFIGLRFAEGDTVRAGDVLAYLAESPEAEIPFADASAPFQSESETPPAGLRISKPAFALAQQHHLDLSQFPADSFVTEKMVQARLVSSAEKFAAPKSDFDPIALIIYGGGGHGKSLLELVRALGVYRVAGFVDDGVPAGGEILGMPILGGGEKLGELHKRGVRLAINAVGGIGAVSVRMKVFRRIAEAGFTCPAVVHPTAFFEASSVLAPGVQIFPHAYVGSDVNVGFGSIVNTGAIVSHDCTLGNYVNISPGAILAGDVRVGDGALIGMGVTVNLGAKIGVGAKIGNGATIKSDVPANGVVRAGTVWPE
ncbi:MAG: NeuD/PglB/VioB family sugar acetyltransferase [Anaerolineales bacterium]|nr:NeuD/PglB/VioB family sugar acetyltransferase [Anaerolineales bacterium]